MIAMKLRSLLKKLAICIPFLSFFFFATPVLAVSPTFTLYPDGGYAILNREFSVDILLNTAGRDTTNARAVLSFDPDRLEVTKVAFGGLYCQYPEDEYSADNTNGEVILTGFCLDPYYNSDSTSGLFGRVTFRPLLEGTATINFEYSTTGGDDVSAIKDTGSPPINILASRPDGVSYSVVTQVPGGSQAQLPGAGIFDNKALVLGFSLIIVSIVVVTGGGILNHIRRVNDNRNRRTIVL